VILTEENSCASGKLQKSRSELQQNPLLFEPEKKISHRRRNRDAVRSIGGGDGIFLQMLLPVVRLKSLTQFNSLQPRWVKNRRDLVLWFQGRLILEFYFDMMFLVIVGQRDGVFGQGQAIQMDLHIFRQ
jgi:hypothetical protein